MEKKMGTKKGKILSNPVTKGSRFPTIGVEGFQEKGGEGMEDREIIAGLLVRDQTFLAALQEKYGPKLLRLASRFLSSREDAEEAVNDAYFRTWTTIPPQEPEHLFAYVAQLCRYAALEKVDWLTAKKRSATVVELTEELCQCLPDPAPQRQAEGAEIGAAINAFLSTLEPEKRKMFLLRYWYGDPVRTVAERCGVGESKVKTTLFRLRKDLKNHLEKEGIAL